MERGCAAATKARLTCLLTRTGSWAWYSLTGLALAELVVAYDLPALAKHRVHRHGPQLWMVPTVMLALGVALKYLGALIPEMRNDELVAHAARDDGSLNWVSTASQQYESSTDAQAVPRRTSTLARRSTRASTTGS